MNFLLILLPPVFRHNFMPITSPICVRPVGQEEFAHIDYVVMRHAFDSQNELGRLLAPEHDAQLLNYLCLQGAHHGKLINFRPTHVESRFLNSSLTAQARRAVAVDSQRWRGTDPASEVLRATLLDLLEDWGGFLELRLYMEALTYFLGGEEEVARMVELRRDSVPLGNQRFHLVSEDTAFRLTALTEGAGHYERQLDSLLRHSPLRTLHWINLAGHRVQFVTLKK